MDINDRLETEREMKINAEIEKAKVDNDAMVYPSAVNNCRPGRVCVSEEYFEMIEVCALCGKIC